MLDFLNSGINSTNTVGLSFSGAREMEDGRKLVYHAEYARQKDASGSPLDFNADYYHLSLGGSFSGFLITGGYEVLGSDRGVGFQTPLATLHKFNGWADAFLNTPGSGLEDLYFSVNTRFRTVLLTAAYHDFSSNAGSASFGSEIDLMAIFPLSKNVKLIAKAASFDGKNGIPGSDKLWLEGNFTF